MTSTLGRLSGLVDERLSMNPPRKHQLLIVSAAARSSGAELAMMRLVEGTDPLGASWAVRVITGESGNIFTALKRAGVEATVIDLPAELLDSTWRSHGLRTTAGFSSAVRTLSNEFRRQQPSLVHVNSLKALYWAAPAAWMAKTPYTVHARDFLPVRAEAIAARYMARKSVGIVANSYATLRSWPYHEMARVVRSPIGDEFFNLRHDRPPARDSGNVQRLVLVGRIAPWKGQHIAISSMKEVILKIPSVRLELVGGPLFGETKYMSFLHRLTSDLGLDSHVTFVGQTADVASVMADAHIALHTSVRPEPMGQSVAQAMAAGVPVIAANAGGVPEFAKHGHTAILVKPNHVPSLAGAIIHLLQSRDVRQSLSVSSSSAVQEFRLHHVREAMSNFLSSALEFV